MGSIYDGERSKIFKEFVEYDGDQDFQKVKIDFKAKPVFKVGDRVRQKPGFYRTYDNVVHEINGPLQAPAIVTEITSTGFKYQFVDPVQLGARLGTTMGGEAFMPEMWEHIATPEPIDYNKFPSVWLSDNLGSNICRKIYDAMNNFADVIFDGGISKRPKNKLQFLSDLLALVVKHMRGV